MFTRSVILTVVAVTASLAAEQSINRGLYFPGGKSEARNTLTGSGADSRVQACLNAKAMATNWLKVQSPGAAYLDGKLITPGMKSSLSICDCEKGAGGWTCSVDASVNWTEVRGGSLEKGLYVPSGTEARNSFMANDLGSRVQACTRSKASANSWLTSQAAPIAYLDGKLTTLGKTTSLSECDCEQLEPVWPSWASEQNRKDRPDLKTERGWNCSVDAAIRWTER